MRIWLALGSVLLLAGCSATPQALPTAPPPAPFTVSSPVMTIGDSIMNGYGLDPDQDWPTLLAQENGWQLTNLACDGAGFLTIGASDECDDTFRALVTSAIKRKPSTIIIEGSSNDFGQAAGALRDETVHELADLHTALPGAHIIGLSTIWNERSDIPDEIAEIDADVKTAVTNVGGTFVDLGQPLLGHPEWMQKDDVHPTAAGQRALAAAIGAAMTKAGISLR